MTGPLGSTGRIGAARLARLLGDWRGAPLGAGYLALAAAVRALLRDGRLGLSVRLPAERVLAAELGASRTTVSAAYRLLREQGYLTSRRGSGSTTRLPSGPGASTTGVWAPDDDADIDLGCASLPAPEGLTAAAERAVARLGGYAEGHGYHPAGLPELRAVLADRYTRAGVPTGPEEILVTTGAQQALDLLLRLLAAPGERMLLESPTYPNALAALGQSRLAAATVAVGPDGWDLDPVLPGLAAGHFRMAYLIPDFHNPTGALLGTDGRHRLLRAARAGGTPLVVDETFADLWHEVPPDLPRLAALDRHRRVVTVNTMSKAYWGGLRVGWLRAAPALVQRLVALRAAADMAGAVLDQLVALELLERSADLLAARRSVLTARRDVLASAVREYLPDWRFRVPDGGVTLWVELDEPVSSALARAAERHGLRLAPGPMFGAEGTLERFLRLPFTRPEAELVESVRRLAAARADLDAPGPRRPAHPTVVA